MFIYYFLTFSSPWFSWMKVSPILRVSSFLASESSVRPAFKNLRKGFLDANKVSHH